MYLVTFFLHTAVFIVVPTMHILLNHKRIIFSIIYLIDTTYVLLYEYKNFMGL